ncbi:hypothetical protein Tco_1051149 [Tanacetum coccineum]
MKKLSSLSSSSFYKYKLKPSELGFSRLGCGDAVYRRGLELERCIGWGLLGSWVVESERRLPSIRPWMPLEDFVVDGLDDGIERWRRDIRAGDVFGLCWTGRGVSERAAAMVES